MALDYTRPRSMRTEDRQPISTHYGGKLTPVMGVHFQPNEAGVIDQTAVLELAPIAGRMVTPIRAEMVAVFVPVQAMYALANPTEDYAGNTDILREKMIDNALFGVEEEHEISKRMGIQPRSVDGTKYVSEMVRLAHNAAVNHLRQLKYVKATQLLASSTAITPALLSQTILEKLNGVLDPEDRVDGAVQFDATLAISGNAPLKNIWSTDFTETAMELDGTSATPKPNVSWSGNPNTQPYTDMSDGTVDMTTSEMSLTDFYRAENMDRIVRQMRKMIDENPQYGEEMVTRAAHGLSVDFGRVPRVLRRREQTFGTDYSRAMDGTGLTNNVTQTNSMTQMNITVPVPKTELGGIVVTFISIKPLENLGSQPHPTLTREFTARNYVAEEQVWDPVPVTMRDLDADVTVANEETIAMHMGLNHLERYYENYGFTRDTDMNDVENKTALWTLEVPRSVTPDSVIYPESLDVYPFADWLAPVATSTLFAKAMIASPIRMGPTPVEELAQIETDNIFEDAEEV